MAWFLMRIWLGPGETRGADLIVKGTDLASASQAAEFVGMMKLLQVVVGRWRVFGICLSTTDELGARRRSKLGSWRVLKLLEMNFIRLVGFNGV